MPSNLEKLEQAGLILSSAVPEAHRDVIEDLSDEEVTVILDVAARLAKVDQEQGLSPTPAFTTFFTF